MSSAVKSKLRPQEFEGILGASFAKKIAESRGLKITNLGWEYHALKSKAAGFVSLWDLDTSNGLKERIVMVEPTVVSEIYATHYHQNDPDYGASTCFKVASYSVVDCKLHVKIANF